MPGYRFHIGQYVKFEEYLGIGYGKIVSFGPYLNSGNGRDYIILVDRIERKSPYHNLLQTPGREIEIWESNMVLTAGQLFLDI